MNSGTPSPSRDLAPKDFHDLARLQSTWKLSPNRSSHAVFLSRNLWGILYGSSIRKPKLNGWPCPYHLLLRKFGKKVHPLWVVPQLYYSHENLAHITAANLWAKVFHGCCLFDPSTFPNIDFSLKRPCMLDQVAQEALQHFLSVFKAKRSRNICWHINLYRDCSYLNFMTIGELSLQMLSVICIVQEWLNQKRGNIINPF